MMLIKDQWYVACPSSQLSDTEPTAIQIGSDFYVAFRDHKHEAHILLDRCCHRGVKLSLGNLRNGCIACGYHGWEYNGNGKLVSVPSLGAESSVPGYSVPSFPTIEKYQYVWIWVAGEQAEPNHEPVLRGVDSGSWIQQSAIWNTHVMPAVENQLDVAHTAFAHPGIYPTHRTSPGEIPTLRKADYICEIDHKSVLVVGTPVGSDIPDVLPTPEHPGAGFGLFELPYRNYVFLENEGVRAIYNWVPLSASSCRLEFLMRSKESDALVFNFQHGELELLSQDRILLESAQHWFGQGIETYEKSVLPDGAPLAARKLVKSLLDGSVCGHEEKRRITYSAFA